MVLQLFAFVKPPHRYQSSLLQQHSSLPVKPCGRCAPKQFVFLWRDWSFSASVRCHYEPWFPQVPSKVLHTSPSPLQPCKGASFSPLTFLHLRLTLRRTLPGSCLTFPPAPSHPSLSGSLCWLFLLSLIPEGACCRVECDGGCKKGFSFARFCWVSQEAAYNFLLQCATSWSHSHNFYLVFPCQHWRLNISSGSWPCVPAHIWQRPAFQRGFTEPMLFTNLAAEESHFSPSKLYPFLKEQQTHC